MKLLALGDIVGSVACDVVCKHLWTWRKEIGADMVIANAENVCCGNGNGLDRESAARLLQCGVDCITGGNHIFRKRNLHPFLEENNAIVRPANYPDHAPGHGATVLNIDGWRILCANVMGQTYLEPTGDPFDCIERLLKRNAGDYDCAILDVHAEATSEKAAIARCFDGQFAAVFGTHTHVQTNDAQILPRGCGFVTDIGMCGPQNSILGVKVENVLYKFREKLPTLFELGDGVISVRGAVFDIDCEKNVTTSVTLFAKDVPTA